MKRFWNLRTKIICLSILICWIPFFTGTLILIKTEQKEYYRQMNSYSQYALELLSSEINQAMSAVNNLSLYTIASQPIRDFLSLENDSTLAFQEAEDAAISALDFLPHTSEFIHYCVVQSFHGQKVSNGPGYFEISTQEIEQAVAEQGTAIWDVQDYLGDRWLVQYRLLRDGRRLSKHLGIVKIYVKLSTFENMLVPALQLPSTESFFFDQEGNIIISQRTSKLPFEQLDPQWLHPPTDELQQIRCNGSHYFLRTKQLAHSPWSVASLYTDDYIQERFANLKNTLLFALSLFVSSSLLLIFLFSRLIVKPIRKISALMDSIRKEDFSVRTPVDGQDEIALLQARFNAMSTQLEKLYRENYVYDLHLKDAQLKEMQMKINPHFLYNTLNTVYWMNQNGNTTETGSIILSLSKLFRLSLHTSKAGIISVRNEIEHVECYIDIQRIRHKDIIHFHTCWDPEVYQYSTLALVMQPLVENAIIHGIEPLGHGECWIYAKREDDKLVFEVINDGQPLDLHAIETLLESPVNRQSTRGFALKNISDRCKLRFGDHYGLSCRILEDSRISFRISQPLYTEEDFHVETTSC